MNIDQLNYSPSARAMEQLALKLQIERDKLATTLQYVTAQLIEAGLDDGAAPVEEMARRAVVMSKQNDRLRAKNAQLKDDLHLKLAAKPTWDDVSGLCLKHHIP